jgi:hypothetical protein
VGQQDTPRPAEIVTSESAEKWRKHAKKPRST